MGGPASAFAPGTVLAVGVGGALGTLSRYAVGIVIQSGEGRIPTGTLLVNIIGAVALGMLSTVPPERLPLSSRVRAFVGTGFCGGLTMFSTMSLQVYTLLDGTGAGFSYLVAASYVAVSLVGAVLAIVAGRLAGRWLFSKAEPDVPALQVSQSTLEQGTGSAVADLAYEQASD